MKLDKRGLESVKKFWCDTAIVLALFLGCLFFVWGAVLLIHYLAGITLVGTLLALGLFVSLLITLFVYFMGVNDGPT